MQKIPDTTMTENGLMTIDAAAARLGVSRRTANRYIAAGHLAYIDHGSRRYISENAIRDYFVRAAQLGEGRREKTARRRNRTPRDGKQVGN